jgi:hypothetical protein
MVLEDFVKQLKEFIPCHRMIISWPHPHVHVTPRRHSCLLLARRKHDFKAPQIPFVLAIREENGVFTDLNDRPNLKLFLQDLYEV